MPTISSTIDAPTKPASRSARRSVGQRAAPRLRRFRQRMDALDGSLVALLQRRSHLSVSIARIKREAGLPLRAASREDEILRQVKRAAQDPLTPRSMAHIFRVILAEMCSAQRRHTR